MSKDGRKSGDGGGGNGELKFLREFGVVLCVVCKCCVAPHVVVGHFRDGKAHRGVKMKRIEEMVC